MVAHRVSMMVVQSQLADTLLDQDPAGARTAINAVEDAGRDALAELRSVLGLLHHEGSAARSPGDTSWRDSAAWSTMRGRVGCRARSG